MLVMLVCHCNGVSDRTVRRTVREGALTVGEVGLACGAGTCCQGCSEMIGEIIQLECGHHDGVADQGATASASTPAS